METSFKKQIKVGEDATTNLQQLLKNDNENKDKIGAFESYGSMSSGDTY